MSDTLKTYAPAWEQRHAFKVGFDLSMGKLRDWRLAGAWEIRSGRPRTEVTPIYGGGGNWSLDPGPTNGEHYGVFSELSLRLEHALPLKDKARLFLYIDVLNAYMGRGEIVWIYGPGESSEDGWTAPPKPFVFRQLPVRPWLGARIEF